MIKIISRMFLTVFILTTTFLDVFALEESFPEKTMLSASRKIGRFKDLELLERDESFQSVLKRKYPGLIFDIQKTVHFLFPEGSEVSHYSCIFAISRNMENLRIEQFFKGTKLRTERTLSFNGIFSEEFMIDSIRFCGGDVISGKKADGTLCFINLENEEKKIDLCFPDSLEVLFASFDREGFSFIEAIDKDGLGYWHQSAQGWTCFARNNQGDFEMMKGTSSRGEESYYLCHYNHDNTGDLQLFQKGSLMPTNVNNFPFTIVQQMMDVNLIRSLDDPQKLVAIRQSKKGISWIDFFVNPEMNEKRLQTLIKRAKIEKFLPDDVPFRFLLGGLKFTPEDLLLSFSLRLASENGLYGNCRFDDQEDKITIDWKNNDAEEVAVPLVLTTPHPFLEMVEFPTPSGDLHYGFCKPQEGVKISGKTMVIIPGGPESVYEFLGNKEISQWCKMGHSVLITQGSFRTGYGYSNWRRGFKNESGADLKEIIDMIHHGLGTGRIPSAEDVILIGVSYGGELAIKFSLGKVPLSDKFQEFKSIIADAPVLAPMKEIPEYKRFVALHENIDTVLEASPFFLVGRSLKMPLFLMVGEGDVRCPFLTTQDFVRRAFFGQKNNPFVFLLYPGGHENVLFGGILDLSVRFKLIQSWIDGVPWDISSEEYHAEGLKIVHGQEFLLKRDS